MLHTRSLPAELTIYTIGELHPQWLGWLSQVAEGSSALDAADNPFCVAADAVDEVDAAGIQLLLSLDNSLKQHQRPLRLLNPSAPLAQACAALGVTSLLAESESRGAAA